jgi:predicted dehydrogenase
MLNLAMVGVGAWGRSIVASLQARSDKVRIVHVADRDAALAAQVAAPMVCAHSGSFESALADPAVQAVILVTPHLLHADQVVACAGAGKHILVDKPLALARVQAQRAVDAVRAAGVQLGLGHNQRFGGPQSQIKRLLDAGELGTPMHLEGNTSHDLLAEVTGWRHDPEQAPTGGLVHMGSHLIDLFCDWAGPAESVFTQLAHRTMPRDAASALLRFACGATGYVGAVTVTAASRHLQVFGSRGWARAMGPTTLQVGLRGEPVRTLEFPPVDIVRANVECFADAAAGRAPYRFRPEQMVHDAAVLEAAARSAASGRPEAVA